MYTSIIAGFSIYMIPDEFSILFNSSIGIPCLFHFFIFMVSIVISIIFSRVRVQIQKHFLLLPEQITLLRLSNEEILVFDSYIKTDNIIISSFINDPLMNKLKQKGILLHQFDVAGRSYYIITERYIYFMRLFWNPISRRFNRH
ncbi:superinfection exclusion B family protein [Escherichia coli]|nr:superinfection exclusion B family protein [Escherichia coli]ELS7774952.1 superinfection exclusion B family protein [Escherichia coli]